MHTLTLTIPDWVHTAVAALDTSRVDDDTLMALAVELARRNVEHGGGPFGAVIWDGERVLGAGVNRVLDTGYSIAHAEIVAMMCAQAAIKNDATAATQQHLTLFTSAEPCCQCFGAIVWSGVSRVVCGATTADVEAIGFDEGPKPEHWQQSLRARAIDVVEGVQRKTAADVLQQYKSRGGMIY